MKILEPLGCVILCQAVGIFGALFTRRAIHTWYRNLKRPSFAPPDWIFGPVWTILYLFMGIVLYRLWRVDAPGPLRDGALVWFFLQLLLNGLWTPLFFGLKAIRTSLVCIVLMALAIGATMVWLFRFDPLSGWLMLPYFCWVAFATALNAEFARLHKV